MIAWPVFVEKGAVTLLVAPCRVFPHDNGKEYAASEKSLRKCWRRDSQGEKLLQASRFLVLKYL